MKTHTQSRPWTLCGTIGSLEYVVLLGVISFAQSTSNILCVVIYNMINCKKEYQAISFISDREIEINLTGIGIA